MNNLKNHVMSHVNIAELVSVTAIRMPCTGHFSVDVIPLDATKRIVFDESALKTMNDTISEKAAQFDARDPKAPKYIEEFVSRLLPEFDRLGLVMIEDIGEAPSDPYKSIREKFKK
jgi:hypothetical protein